MRLKRCVSPGRIRSRTPVTLKLLEHTCFCGFDWVVVRYAPDASWLISPTPRNQAAAAGTLHPTLKSGLLSPDRPDLMRLNVPTVQPADGGERRGRETTQTHQER